MKAAIPCEGAKNIRISKKEDCRLKKGFLGRAHESLIEVRCPRVKIQSQSPAMLGCDIVNPTTHYSRALPWFAAHKARPMGRGICRLFLQRARDCSNYLRLPQRGCLFMAPFQLEHHAFDVLVVLVRLQELQTLLRIAPLQDLNALLTRAPRIHLALIGHIEVDRIATGERPAVVLHAIRLAGGKQAKNCADRPARVEMARGQTGRR